MEKIIVDTGALYALVDRNDKWHKDRNLGFVDASLLALSERLNIYHILTVDRRDFSGIKVKGKLLKLYP